MSDKCSNKNCFGGTIAKKGEKLHLCPDCGGTGFIEPKDEKWNIHDEPCPTCNPQKSEGPRYPHDPARQDAYDEGRASLIPLVRELVGAMDEYYKEECSEGKALYEKAKKEIEK